MNENGLTAEVIKSICRILDSQRALLAEAITARQYEAQPELAARYGDAGRAKCVADAGYHLSYLADAVGTSSTSLFSDYIAWAKVMLSTRGIPAMDLSRNLVIMHEVVREKLPAEVAPLIDEYFEAALNKLPAVSDELATPLEDTRPHTALAKSFIKLLLKGERHLASRLILEAVDSGVDVKDIYLQVFQPSQQELGRLWQLNQIS